MHEIQLTNKSADAPVRVFEKALKDSHKLGIIRLNKPASLNALSLQMVELMSQQLQVWKDDEAIVAVWLEGEGERAFCAGGNVVEVYESVVAAERPDPAVVEDYFKKEYALDFCLHTYPKPVICWGQGIVMGGGMGLFMAADVRVVTETSRLAMPEITIGLFPDVGASYFLNQIDVTWARFIALTGCHLSCSDAMALGMANVLVSQESKKALLESLDKVHWDGRDKERSLVSLKQLISPLSQRLSSLNHVDNHVKEHTSEIAPLMVGSIEEIDQKIRQWKPETAWLKKAKQSFLSGSALSAHIILRQLEVHRQSSLHQVFDSELNLITALCHKGDFAEGVRALLVDKDKSPTWRFSSVTSVNLEDVEQFLPFN
ncbi:enoyl-CoA hydratase/isomerase family protein [Marinomonas aquiplantarum]|uniref:3-hydroxyisobutyryl-CoA hydrolase n=1 Tax=Marinomonas aquiplantarum TaxID=491951 RepID=A0A366D209_9GAMM|nr:enoyl-CoA hydratase/isomerase family protein [Marinomonas aquiplantarum]RBO84110.1 enoyl-CoA hydratase/isomerase-like protein [Marinomonas aquiplantarum]